jgi:hypothetical protein
MPTKIKKTTIERKVVLGSDEARDILANHAIKMGWLEGYKKGDLVIVSEFPDPDSDDNGFILELSEQFKESESEEFEIDEKLIA